MPLPPLRRLGDGSRPVAWEILEALECDLGIVLWTQLRGIYEWARPLEDGSRRFRLFQPPTEATQDLLNAACAEAPQIANALRKLALLRERGGDVDPEVVATACSEIADWAEERSLLPVAGHFGEAGAYASPENPVLANTAGRLCRRLGLFERSAEWFKRARSGAVRTGNPREKIRALLGYGSLMRSLGRYETAKAQYLRAARLAERTRRRKQAAEAQHDLLAVAILMDDLQAAEEHVWEALRLYPARHPHLPVLGHDWAFALVLRRYYSHAIPLIELALSRVRPADLRTLLFSTLARAAAGAGQLTLHKQAESQALAHAGRFAEYAAPALINLAQAAWLLGDWDRAKEHAQRGLAAADSRADPRYQRDAADLLGRFSRRELPPVEQTPQLADALDMVRMRYAARLRETPPPRFDGFDAGEGRSQPGN